MCCSEGQTALIEEIKEDPGEKIALVANSLERR